MTNSDQLHIARRTNIGDIARRGARRQGQKVALVMGNRRITYTELNEWANQIAQSLIGLQLGRGARIAVLARNSPEFLVLYFACAKAGAVLCPANPMQQEKDIAYILNHAEVDALFMDACDIERFCKVKTQVSSIRHVFVLSAGDEGGICGIGSLCRGALAIDPETPVGDRDLAMVMYTSGTTSAPKGAMLSHTNVVTGAVQNAFAGEITEFTVATCILPLFHCGQLSLTSGALLRGATVVLMNGFDSRYLLKAIQSEQINWVFALPAMYRTLLADPMLDASDLSSLRFCLYAMTPMDTETLRRAMERFNVRFALTSGQTEVYPPTVVFAPEFQLGRSGTFWGRATPLTEIAIMDDEGRLIDDGSEGEIVYRGANVMEGYLHDPEATAEAFAGGWFHSGDLGRFDGDDLLVFVDRKKDVIKTGGENVSSIKVERCLLAHPEIVGAAAVGLPHDIWGEAVAALVTLTDSSVDIDEAAMIFYCKQQLSGHEVPKRIIVVDTLPQTATGKIQKNVLRSSYAGLFTDAMPTKI